MKSETLGPSAFLQRKPAAIPTLTQTTKTRSAFVMGKKRLITGTDFFEAAAAFLAQIKLPFSPENVKNLTSST